MSNLLTWVISLAGVCLLSVIVDLCMPEGKMTASIKQVFSFVIILVAITPLSGLIKGEYNLGVFENTDFELQDNYIYNINQAKLDKWTEDIELSLNNKGIYGAVVSISANIFEQNMQVLAVYVDLYNTVISGQNQNINIKTEVVSVVLDILNIKEDKVIFYE